METPPHKQSNDEPPQEGGPQKSWHWWYGHEEHLHGKKEPAKKAPQPSSASTHGHTEKTNGKPRTEVAPSGEKAGTYKEIPRFEALLNDPRIGEKSDETKKNWIKQELRQAKYDIQGSDYDRVKAITDKGGSTPLRININWNKAKGEYRDVWRNLRTWAIDNKIWNEKDETEFIKETGGRKDGELNHTARNMGLNVATGALYGVGYAIIAPWKAFELGLKFASSITGDEKYTHGMMEKIFGKEKERGSGKWKGKKEDWNKIKENEVRNKVKETEQDYLRDIKEQITDQKIELLLASPEYLTATAEERARLDTEIAETKSGLYQKAWRKMRTHWIQLKMWNHEDEKKFRNEVGYTPGTTIEQVRKDFLTRSEWNELKSLRETRRKKEATQEKQAQGSRKYNELNHEIKELDINIEEILDKSEIRLKTESWPFDEDGKQKTRRSYEESVADTEDEESEDEES